MLTPHSKKNTNASLRGKKLLAKISDQGTKANCYTYLNYFYHAHNSVLE
jgi:hypothetical protein